MRQRKQRAQAQQKPSADCSKNKKYFSTFFKKPIDNCDVCYYHRKPEIYKGLEDILSTLGLLGVFRMMNGSDEDNECFIQYIEDTFDDGLIISLIEYTTDKELLKRQSSTAIKKDFMFIFQTLLNLTEY